MALIGSTSSSERTTIRSGTTKSDVGLGSVDNESKSTMFTSPTFTGNAVLGQPASGDMVNTLDGKYAQRHQATSLQIPSGWSHHSAYSVMGGATTFWICLRTFTTGNATYGYNNRDVMIFTHPSSNLVYTSATHYHRSSIGDGTMHNGCITMSSFHTSSTSYACHSRLTSTANSNVNGILAPNWYSNIASSSAGGVITYYDFF